MAREYPGFPQAFCVLCSSTIHDVKKAYSLNLGGGVYTSVHLACLDTKSKVQPLRKAMPSNLSIKAYKIGADLAIEGWISTPMRDLEGDILEPEAFSGAGLSDYMARGAPVSVEHQTRNLPVGYLTRARLVRAGKVLQEEFNPKQAGGDFRYYSGGTGWYASGMIYDSELQKHISKGAVSSFSWIGLPVTWESLPGRGRHFKQAGSINPLSEVTVTGFPINTSASMHIVKGQTYEFVS